MQKREIERVRERGVIKKRQPKIYQYVNDKHKEMKLNLISDKQRKGCQR